MAVCTFYLARHGETEFNKKGFIMGHKDSPLTEKGIAQAEALAEDLRQVHFDAAFSSDLERSYHTAEIVAASRGLTIVHRPELRERSYGIYEGGSLAAYRLVMHALRQKLKHLTLAEKWKYHYPDGIENDESLMERLVSFLHAAAVTYAGKTVLVVSHGAVLRTFLVYTGYATRDEVPAGSIKNGGYLIVESDGTHFFIRGHRGLELRTAKK